MLVTCAGHRAYIGEAGGRQEVRLKVAIWDNV